jgi:hypothetical protein
MRRIVVAIDPAGSSNKNSDETGIIVAGVDRAGIGYILADLSGKYSPEAWARKAVGAYKGWRADWIIAEKNYGGDMVASTIKSVDPYVRVKLVIASRGKAIRAEPVASYYEQGRVKHVGGLHLLEDQMCEWDPAASGPSPDRLDACIGKGAMIITKRGDVPIEDNLVGDMVLTRNGFRAVTATRMTSPCADVVLVETDAGSVFATPDHRFFVDGDWKSADNIEVQDTIYNCNCIHAHVVGVTAALHRMAVYDLSVDGEHEFFANGMLVHNCVWALSELMNARPPIRIDRDLLERIFLPNSRRWDMGGRGY